MAQEERAVNSIIVERVARMQRSAIRVSFSAGAIPDFASLHPGYEV